MAATGWKLRAETGMQVDWAVEHCEALREYLARGISFSRAAAAINARFNTGYSRSAAIGRARRMGIAGSGGPKDAEIHRPERPPGTMAEGLQQPRERHVPEFRRRTPAIERPETRIFRCVEIVPRHLSLIDLEPGDCRYPYGGDAEGEAITFCGHPRREGSSYCTPHFHLTRGPGTASERTAAAVLLRLVKAA
jgi:GcrA cell cycle regulator